MALLQKFLLAFAIGGFGLVAIAKITAPMIRAYDASLPRTHFYSEEAWKNCAGMHSEAKARGFDAWTCHMPGGDGPG